MSVKTVSGEVVQTASTRQRLTARRSSPWQGAEFLAEVGHCKGVAGRFASGYSHFMNGLREFPKKEIRSRQALRDWLHANHKTSETFWLVSFKKHVKERHVPYDAIVEELLCYGWIDTRTRRLDEDRTMLLVAPRKPGGSWSASNKKRVAKLEKAGLMTPAGREKIDAARRDGSWSYLDDVENLVVPEDLSRALEANQKARAAFDAFSKSARKVILLWIKTAKRNETRAQRVSETVRLAAKGLKAAHPEAKGQ